MSSLSDTHFLEEMTYTEAEVRLRSGAVALLPCGSTEAHGPHLPLNTDVLIAKQSALRTAQLLSEQDIPSIVLPPLPYAVTHFAAGFTGTITIPEPIATSFVEAIIRGAIKTGAVGVVLCNAHLEPAHIRSLQEAMSRCIGDGLHVAFPNICKRPHALRLGAEFRSGACHAGSYETSLVMASDAPFLVRRMLAKRLPTNPNSLSIAIRDGKRNFEDAGGPAAYFGAPSEAS